MLGHFVLGAQAFEVSFQLLLNLGVVAVSMDADQLIGILAEVEQLPFFILIKMDQLVATIGYSIVSGDTVGAGKLVVVIVKMGAPVFR